MMKTEILTEDVITKSATNLMQNLPAKINEKLFNDQLMQQHQPFHWKDIRGLSWIFISDEVI